MPPRGVPRKARRLHDRRTLPTPTSRKEFQMRMPKPLIALLAVAAGAALPVLPQTGAPRHGESADANIFVVMCERAADGKVTKQQVMAIVDRMFDKQDTKKEGKLDKKQVNFFLRDLTAPYDVTG